MAEVLFVRKGGIQCRSEGLNLVKSLCGSAAEILGKTDYMLKDTLGWLNEIRKLTELPF